MEISVPWPRRDSICNVPPMALTRSRIATSPSPLRGAPGPRRILNPAPSSRIVQHCVRSSRQARIQTLLALACLTAFVSAS